MHLLAIIAFSVSIFVSAFLLFSVQPLFAKLILPLLGGTPQVWNTCMLFFQFALLAGYFYAHTSSRILGVKKQALFHVVLAAIVIALMPIGISQAWTPPAESDPTFWLLMLLSVHIGLPFFVLSANSPLIQKWFSETEHESSKDPYFLYASSNVGSLFALLSYPFFVEPFLRLSTQTRFWSLGYILYVVSCIVCVLLLIKSKKKISVENSAAKNEVSSSPVGLKERLTWVLYAFVPASLMYGVTAYLSTDIASFPLLWIIPLSLYLLTFILAFSDRGEFVTKISSILFPIVVIPLVIILAIGARIPMLITIVWNLLSFFVMALYCHGHLARMRPNVTHLTEYYLWLSVGGVIGGIFNSLLAPVLFNWPIEYQIAIIVASILRTKGSELRMVAKRWFLRILPTAFGIFLICVLAYFFYEYFSMGSARGQIFFGALILLTLISFCFHLTRTLMSILSVVAMIAIFFINPNVEYSKRSYFGVHRVKTMHEDHIRSYLNGSTVHGMQSLNPALSGIPTTYYHPTGPIGDIMDAYHKKPGHQPAAFIGLGIGSLAAYAREGDEWTFYEIDPYVVEIAQNEKFFTFLRDTRADIDIVMGDGRVQIEKAPDGHYGLILIDAFSSDSIPVHLITKEAIQIYLKKLKEDGILVFHISNRHVSLAPVLKDLAEHLGLIPLASEDIFDDLTPTMRRMGKKPSAWMVMVRDAAHMGMPGLNSQKIPESERPQNVWTDDYSNIVRAFKLK